jgi:hypothetical protein
MAKEIAKPLVYSLSVSCLKMVELPAKNHVLELAVVADGAPKEIEASKMTERGKGIA